ncbi:MAG: hypothetical protein AAF184_13930 [Pseudomonadota bacterium]
MNKLIMSIVLVLGVSGAAGAPVLSAPGDDLGVRGAPAPHPVERVTVATLGGGDAQIILLRLGVDPGLIERHADGVTAPLTLGQRAALGRLESVQLR